MAENTGIVVMLLTCDRWDYAEQTVAALARNLRASEPIHLVIADDSRGEGVDDFQQYAQGAAKGSAIASVTLTRTGGKSYGASYNNGTQTAHALGDIILPIEDDWELTQPLDLDPFSLLLRGIDSGDAASPRPGCFRLGYLGHTDTVRGTLRTSTWGQYLELDPDSPEKHVFAGHPRIESRDWERFVGPWPEGLRAGATELVVCGNPNARKGVCWPLWLTPGRVFGHIGTDKADPTPTPAGAE